MNINGSTGWLLAATAWAILGVFAYRWRGYVTELLQQADKAQARVGAGQRRFIRYATTAKDAMVVIDSEGRVVFWNTTSEKLFGWTAGQMIGQTLQRIMPKRHWKPHQTALARLRQGESPRLMDKILKLEAVNAAGVEFPIELALGQWSDVDQPEGSDWSYVGVIRPRKEDA